MNEVNITKPYPVLMCSFKKHLLTYKQKEDTQREEHDNNDNDNDNNDMTITYIYDQ